MKQKGEAEQDHRPQQQRRWRQPDEPPQWIIQLAADESQPWRSLVLHRDQKMLHTGATGLDHRLHHHAGGGRFIRGNDDVRIDRR